MREALCLLHLVVPTYLYVVVPYEAGAAPVNQTSAINCQMVAILDRLIRIMVRPLGSVLMPLTIDQEVPDSIPGYSICSKMVETVGSTVFQPSSDKTNEIL